MGSSRRSLRSRLRGLLAVAARRRSQRKGSGRFRSARHIVGPTGNMFSRGWDRYAEGAEAFNKSFEPKIPPSIHVSHNDSVRHRPAVPLSERCVEDWGSQVSYTDPYDELGDELSAPQRRKP